MRQGRNKCSQACCRGKGADQFLISYYTMGYTTKEIGKMCRTSDTHIAGRLKALGVQMRRSKDYPERRKGRNRESPLWKLSEKDLFETPMSVLMERYGASASSVGRIRRRRRSERTS
jgi:hypothetical protein